MPLGILVDLYMGYNAGVGPATNHWNVLPMSGNDTALDFLFKQQLFVDSGLPDAELKTTPYGQTKFSPTYSRCEVTELMRVFIVSQVKLQMLYCQTPRRIIYRCIQSFCWSVSKTSALQAA